MKRFLSFSTIVSLVVLAACISMLGSCKQIRVTPTDDRIRAAESIRPVAEGMYELTFSGNYGLDKFIAQGGASNLQELTDFIGKTLYHGLDSAPQLDFNNEFGCSYITSRGKNGKFITGRNFDWPECRYPIAVIRTIPDKGYASISTICTVFLNFGEDYQATRNMSSRLQLIAGIYAPLDGINEKGLTVADLVAGDMVMTNQQTERPNLTTTTAIRLLLDKAATTDEAMALLRQYDMHSDINFALHLAISDAKGHSVVAEWVNDSLFFAETAVCTNHYVAESSKKGQSMYYYDSHYRYDLLQHLQDSLPAMSADDILEALRQVAEPGQTRWSIVYDRKHMTATYYQNADFSQPYVFNIR